MEGDIDPFYSQLPKKTNGAGQVAVKKNAFGARGASKNSFSDAVKNLPTFAPILCEKCCNFRVAAMGPNCVFKVLPTILATRLNF